MFFYLGEVSPQKRIPKKCERAQNFSLVVIVLVRKGLEVCLKPPSGLKVGQRQRVQLHGRGRSTLQVDSVYSKCSGLVDYIIGSVAAQSRKGRETIEKKKGRHSV
jgi:hypothetical protein